MRRSSSLLSLAEPLAPFIAAWTSLYLLARFVLFRQRSADFANRVVSVVHALAAILLAVPALDWSAPLGRTRCMTVSLAYFLYDLVCCLVIDPRDVVGTVHHLCTMAGFVVGLDQSKCGTELVACLLLMEVSNPFMHCIKLFKEAGVGESRLAAANQLLFALLFFVCRLLLGPVVVHATLRSPTTPALVKAGGTGILLVSLLWFRKIAAIALAKLRGVKPSARPKRG